MLPALRRVLTLTVITLPLLSLSATAADRLKVVASFSIIGDFARNVGGDRIDLSTLVGPDGDAHVYEPKPADAAALAQADVVLVNGLNFEGFLKRLADSSGTRAPIVELTRGVEPRRIEGGHAHADDGHDAAHEDAEAAQTDEAGHDHAAGDIDPHAFQSIANARIYVRNIADAFCAADAQGCDAYRANASAYDARLADTEAKVKAAIAQIPADRRIIITSHDAFGYFEHAYGLTFLAPEGLSTEAEATAADVAALVRQIREDKASALFVESITNAKLIEQISRETGLRIGGTLHSDALSPAGGPAPTYIDMMLNNVATIKGAILGS
ncbi:MAG: zinc ABC transporter substrate-binding protein [Rhizobiaceae bacterium]|nr:zinc ABC transporter substrate-binding protein [Rhizobiaceae bacterium]